MFLVKVVNEKTEKESEVFCTKPNFVLDHSRERSSSAAVSLMMTNNQRLEASTFLPPPDGRLGRRDTTTG